MDTRLQIDAVLKAVKNPAEFIHPTMPVITDLVRGKLGEVDKHLVKYTKPITATDSPLVEIFFWVGLIGGYNIVAKFLGRSLFNKQMMKKLYLREVINGCKQRAEIYRQKPTYKNISVAIMAYENALAYQMQIPFKNAADLVIFNEINFQLIKLYNNRIAFLKHEQSYSEALQFNSKKLVCLNNLDALKKLTDAQLDNVSESVDEKSTMIAVAAEWGFDYQGIPQDGNCFFHAIAHQVEINNMPLPVLETNVKLHQFYRQQGVNTIRANKVFFQQYFDGAEDFDKYLETMEQAGEWADDLIITALIAYLKVTLIIIKCGDNKPHIIKVPNASHILQIGYEGSNHYVSLIHRVDNAGLYELIASEPVMNMEDITPILDFQDNTGLITPSTISRTASFDSSLQSLSPTPTVVTSTITSDPVEKTDNTSLLSEQKQVHSFKTPASSPKSIEKKPKKLSLLRNIFSNLFKLIETPEDEGANSANIKQMLTLGQVMNNPTKNK